MSTEPRPQAAFLQINQNAAEQDAPNSALFYLFQEVSKLASATQNRLLDTHSPSILLDETTTRDGVIATKEDGVRSFQLRQQSLSRTSAYSQEGSVKEGSHSNEFTAEAHRDCSSPWKVLSLINLQCEKLMHRKRAEDSAYSSSVSSADIHKGHPAVKPLAAATDGAGQDCVGPLGGVRGDSARGGKTSQPRDHSVQPQAHVKTGTVKASPPYLHTHTTEARFSKKPQLELFQEPKADTFFPNQDILPDNVLKHSHTPDASQNAKLTFHLNEEASAKQTLDYNANIILTAEPLYGPQAPPPSASECRSLPTQDFEITGCTHAATSLSAQGQPHTASSPTSEQDPREVQAAETPPPLSQQWRTKTPRKQPHPSRSVDIQDPDLQGVMFRMDTEVDDSRGQCRLLITSKYRKDLCRSARKQRLRTRTSQKSLKSSSSEEESDPATNVSKDKVCASCCTRKTPMWRDAEDGTPLCNACGIRYKKYRVRCANCWHIPRKEGNSNSCCLKCGNFVKLTSVQRKHTT